jgi:hypothetical protein
MPGDIRRRAVTASIMDVQASATNLENPSLIGLKKARLMVRGIQLLFVIIATLQLGGPFLTAHNERQNQTYDMDRHVFEDGWSAILTPKASFSLPGYEARPYTVIRQEFPFHGLLGWPFVKLFGHERVVVRLISIAFSLMSIEFVYLILQRWLNPGSGVIGAALWGLSPLVLQFGQVPMPDILCTAGMLGAFWFALKPNLQLSSAWFLFAILAKLSVIFFGLPILTALLLARNCRTSGEFIRIAVLWGMAPLIGLLCWSSLEIRDPDTPWTVVKLVSQQNDRTSFLELKFYAFLVGTLSLYGLGILGMTGCLLALIKKNALKVRPAILITLLVSNALYVLAVVKKIPEPQYILPLLAWLAILAIFGWNSLSGSHFNYGRRVAVTLLAGLHILVAVFFTMDLKASHVPNINDIENAGRLIPANSRVIVAYPFYGASPAIWLKQNTVAEHSVGELESNLPQLQKDGFDYILIMDVKSHSGSTHMSFGQLAKMASSLFHTGAGTDGQQAANLLDYTATNAPFRQFCDGRFKQLYATRYVVLYSLGTTNYK